MHSSTAPPAPPTARPSGLYHGWLVLATVATNMSVVHGFRYSFTVFYVAILMHFGWDRASTAAIGSVNLVTYGLLVAVSGAVVDRFGPRVTIPAGLVVYIIAILLSGFATELWQFYALTGLLAGAGFAFCGYVPNFVVLTNWFVRRRGLAYGVAQAGGGTSFFLAGLAQLAITWFGWRNAYWLMGAGLGIPVLLMNVLLLRRRPQEMGLEPDGKASAKADAAPVRFQVEVVDPAWVEFRWTLRSRAENQAVLVTVRRQSADLGRGFHHGGGAPGGLRSGRGPQSGVGGVSAGDLRRVKHAGEPQRFPGRPFAPRGGV